MANPQKENGHIEIANEIVEKLFSYRLSGQEWQIIWVVFRKTWGWHKKEDWIALSQFSELTGMDRQRCCRILKGLTEKGVLQKSTTVVKKNNTVIVSYGFQKDFDKWGGVVKKDNSCKKRQWGVVKKDNGVLQKSTTTKETITKDTLTKDIHTPLETNGEDVKVDEVPYTGIITYLNQATHKNFRAKTATTRKFIRARWKDGFSLADFKRVIDTKTLAWLNKDNAEYLRPETLFGTKFESYLNETPQQPNGGQNDESRFTTFEENV